MMIHTCIQWIAYLVSVQICPICAHAYMYLMAETTVIILDT